MAQYYTLDEASQKLGMSVELRAILIREPGLILRHEFIDPRIKRAQRAGGKHREHCDANEESPWRGMKHRACD